MALPDYFNRNAVAASHAISGLNEERLNVALENVRVGITIGRDATDAEGKALSDMLVRLLARLYPTITVRCEGRGSFADDAMELAKIINPRIDNDGAPTVELVIGTSRAKRQGRKRIFVGSNAWKATISSRRIQSCGKSDIPFGAGVAACFAAANLFRHVFLSDPQLDTNTCFSVWGADESDGLAKIRGTLGDIVLAGAGAIGNSAIWSLARTSMEGELAVVDKEAIDLGNLQRYVLANREDEGTSKVEVAARQFSGALAVRPNATDIASFLENRGHNVDSLLLALDSARDRRVCQASLPRWIANAWTQPGDLGVSAHEFLSGACVCCLYLPDQPLRSEDAIIAQAFSVPSRLMQIRTLLHLNGGAPRDLLQAIAEANGIALERLLAFEGRPLRSLYTEGFCGGAVIPLANVGSPPSSAHVPLAHQSALAGVLLAAAAVRHAIAPLQSSYVTQLDVLQPIQALHTRQIAKDPRGQCICHDQDYRDAYIQKFQTHSHSNA